MDRPATSLCCLPLACLLTCVPALLGCIGSPAHASPVLSSAVTGARGSCTSRQPAAPATEPAPVLTLQEAVALALKQSPTLEAARRERNVGLVNADRARPAFRPEVSATASQVIRTPRVDLPGRPDEVVLPNSISRLEIGLRQPLYQFGAGGAPGRRASAIAAAAESRYRKSELDLILEVREGYLDVIRAGAYSEVASQGVELARENVRLTALLQERGFQAEVDGLEARRALLEAESGLLQAENGIELARGNVNRILGRSIDTPFAPASVTEIPDDPGPLNELVRLAASRRPEAQGLRHNMEEAEAGIQLAKALRQPRVNLEAGYALQTPTALVPRSGVTAGLSITLPLFDGALRSFNIREAEERLAQIKSGLRALEDGIALEVQQQRLAMVAARKRLEFANGAIDAARKVHEITMLKLERGHAIQAEVLNARLSLQRALTERATAETDLRLAAVRLDRALGNGVKP